MATTRFNSGRIRKADYDPGSQQLTLHWDNQTVRAYRQVPQEVYRRLCAAPNPATYWEDRVAEEYPQGAASTTASAPDAGLTLRDLFGGSA